MTTTTYQKTIRVILRSMAIFLAMLCISVSSADAHTISVEEAKAKAQRFLSKNSENPEWRARGASAAPAFKLAYESKTTDKSASCFYVLSHPSAGGYIIMSADDRLPEVLGYSDNGEFDINQIPDNMKWWLSEYERQIEQVLTSANGDAVSTDETAHRAGWTAIEPLVKTKWSQREPYNNLCPTINGQSCPTGCTATAMAQIMNYLNYHQWPVTGRGSHSYEWKGQTLSMDFSKVTFDWANMKDDYTQGYSPEEGNAVATLMYACGISLNMNYGLGGSGASFFAVLKSLYDYFDYDADYLVRDAVELPDWESLIYNELVNKRPVLYSGSSYGGLGQHTMVCDGYSSDGLFHINWGWGGSKDGYFLLNILDPFEGERTDNQSIVYGISPISEEYMDDAIKNGITINAENFPDDNFRNYLLEHKYGKDGVLTKMEIKRMELSLNNRSISTLKGIEYFTDLRSLDCYYNQLTALDVSNKKELSYLGFDNNPLTSFNCSRSNFKGEGMDKIIDMLPKNTTNETYSFFVYDDTHYDEGNICTKAQVAALKAKGWTPYYYCDNSWKEYEGAELEDILLAKKADAEATYKTAKEVYEQYMYYYEVYQQAAESQTDNRGQADEILTDIEALEKKISESSLTEATMAAFLATLDEVEAATSALAAESSGLLSDNAFYAFYANVQEYYKQYVSAYNDRLTQYAMRIEAATTIEELNTLTVEIGQDAEETKTQYLNPVISNYNGLDLENTTARLAQIGEELNLCKTRLQSCAVKAAYKMAAEVYEQYMYYYEGEGMSAYQQVAQAQAEAQADNQGKADEILTNVEGLEKTISESGLTEGEKTANLAVLSGIRSGLSSLTADNDSLLSSNPFYVHVQEYYEKYITAYNDRLIQYAARIEAATTIDELDALIAEMEQDAEETKTQYLNPVISNYDGLEQITIRLAQISEKLDGLKTGYQSCADRVEAAIEKIEIAFSKKKDEAKAAYKTAAEVYEQYMYYYEGEGMSAYQQVAQAQAEVQADNQGKADEILTNVEGLEKTISESGLTEGEKTANLAVLSGIRSALSSLTADNDSLLSSNPFYTHVQEYYEKYITAYNDRLIQYAARIEATTTIDELNALIAEMEQDAKETKTQYLNPVISNYEGLEQITTRLAQISEKLDGLKTKYQSCADRVEAAIEKIEIAFSKKKDEAKTVHETAMEVYERYMYYYEGEGMSAYQQVVQAQADNHTEAENLLTDIEALIKTVVESGMTRTEKLSYRTALNDIKASTSALSVENDDLFSANSFYAHVQEYYEKYVSAYNDRLVQYATRIEAATTAEELNTLIAEIEQDAGKMKRQYLNPVIIDYDGLALEKTTARLAQIGEELEGLKTLFLSYADEVEAIITGVPIVKADAKHVIVYTIGGRRQVMKKSELKLLPKGLYIINGKKVWMK